MLSGLFQNKPEKEVQTEVYLGFPAYTITGIHSPKTFTLNGKKLNWVSIHIKHDDTLLCLGFQTEDMKEREFVSKHTVDVDPKDREVIKNYCYSPERDKVQLPCATIQKIIDEASIYIKDNKEIEYIEEAKTDIERAQKYTKRNPLTSKNLLEAAENSDLLNVINFINKGESVNQKNEEGDTLLLAAINRGNYYPGQRLDVVKRLVEAKADVNVQDKHGYTPAYRAALNFQLDILKYLVDEHKAKVDSEVLIRAALGNDLETIKYLVEKCHVDANAQSKFSSNALHCWVLTSSVNMSGGVDCPNYFEGIKYLIEVAKIDVNAVNEDGVTVLHILSCYASYYPSYAELHKMADYVKSKGGVGDVRVHDEERNSSCRM